VVCFYLSCFRPIHVSHTTIKPTQTMAEIKLDLNTTQIDSILEQLKYGKYTAENWDIDLLRGINGEAEILDILAGKIEVKTDFQAYKTNNIAIEIESRGKPSGIQTSEAKWWIFNIQIPQKDPLLIIVPLERLRQIANKYLHQNRVRMGGDNNTSKLVIVPISEVFKG